MRLVKKSLFTSLKRPSAGNNKTYFEYALRHNWQHFAFYLILMLLLVVVPTVMSVQSGLNTQYSVSYYSFESRQNEGSSLLLIASVLTFIASCGVL